ncbi:MAG: signal peptidase I [Lachnospiraceae bacterium]|nr:signal peptidase I [Lachnospiraceae bacterium]
MKKNKKNSLVKSILDTGIFLFTVLIITYLCLTFVTQRTEVKGTSMEPTLYEGDNIMIDKLSYHFRSPKRKEVICFYSENKKEILIKRVIGLPGETVRIEGGGIFIDGKEINDYIGGLNYAGRAVNDVVLSEDEFFVIGDNRQDSIDSRYQEIGNIKKDKILGRAFWLFYPFDRIRMVK